MKLYPLSLTDKISIKRREHLYEIRLNTSTKSVDKDIDASGLGKKTILKPNWFAFQG